MKYEQLLDLYQAHFDASFMYHHLAKGIVDIKSKNKGAH